MKIARSFAELGAALGEARAGRIVGFVPTMGFLHEGHLSLVDRARTEGAGVVVVSIFVNPLQFGPNDDFDRYPRSEERDIELLRQRGVDLLYLPDRSEMYPDSAASSVVMGGVALPLEGERRPGHFNGVATVVMKLFNMLQPHLAVFGRKDAQQCAVIEQLVRDFNIPVRLVFGETQREADGLAMSSRNVYLNADERRRALVLHAALRVGQESLRRGNFVRDAEASMRMMIEQTEGIELDYLCVVDPFTFLPPRASMPPELLIVGALRVGTTRLIDNIRVARAVPTES